MGDRPLLLHPCDRPCKVSPLQLRIRKVCAPNICIRKASTPQILTPKVPPPQILPRKIAHSCQPLQKRFLILSNSRGKSDRPSQSHPLKGRSLAKPPGRTMAYDPDIPLVSQAASIVTRICSCLTQTCSEFDRTCSLSTQTCS